MATTTPVLLKVNPDYDSRLRIVANAWFMVSTGIDLGYGFPGRVTEANAATVLSEYTSPEHVAQMILARAIRKCPGIVELREAMRQVVEWYGQWYCKGGAWTGDEAEQEEVLDRAAMLLKTYAPQEEDLGEIRNSEISSLISSGVLGFEIQIVRSVPVHEGFVESTSRALRKEAESGAHVSGPVPMPPLDLITSRKLHKKHTPFLVPHPRLLLKCKEWSETPTLVMFRFGGAQWAGVLCGVFHGGGGGVGHEVPWWQGRELLADLLWHGLGRKLTHRRVSAIATMFSIPEDDLTLMILEKKRQDEVEEQQQQQEPNELAAETTDLQQLIDSIPHHSRASAAAPDTKPTAVPATSTPTTATKPTAAPATATKPTAVPATATKPTAAPDPATKPTAAAAPMVSFKDPAAVRRVLDLAAALIKQGVGEDAKLTIRLDTRFLFSVLLSPDCRMRDAAWTDLAWLCNFADPGPDLMRMRAAMGLLDTEDFRIVANKGKTGFVDTSATNLRLCWPLSELQHFTEDRMRRLSVFFEAVRVSESTGADKKLGRKYVGTLRSFEGEAARVSESAAPITWGHEVSWFLSDPEKKRLVEEATRIYERDENFEANTMAMDSKQCGTRGNRFTPTEDQARERNWRHTQGVFRFGVESDIAFDVGLQ
jgi:hypothetical protein